MITKLFLWSLSFLIMLIYTLYMIKREGVINCFSRTYYLLKHPWVFTLVLFLSSILVMPIMFDLTPTMFTFLPFLTEAGFIMVGMAPKYRDDDKVMHKASACIAMIASQFWVFLVEPWALLTWIPFLCLSLNDRDDSLLFIEMGTWVTLMTALLLAIVL